MNFGNTNKWNYGEYSASNKGANTQAFTDVFGNNYYYSYETLVAFRNSKTGELVVRENIWNNTTGKHLNWIDGGDKKARVNEKVFVEKLEELRQSYENNKQVN